jgi:hypothetical protein
MKRFYFTRKNLFYALNSIGQETNNKQVPREKVENDYEKRVNECLKLSGGKWSGACNAPRSDVEQVISWSVD